VIVVTHHLNPYRFLIRCALFWYACVLLDQRLSQQVNNLTCNVPPFEFGGVDHVCLTVSGCPAIPVQLEVYMSRIVRSVTALGFVAMLTVPANALAVGPQPDAPAPWTQHSFTNGEIYSVGAGSCPVSQTGTYQYDGAGVGWVEGPDFVSPQCSFSSVKSGYYCAQYNGSGSCTLGVFWDNVYWPNGSSSGPRTAVYPNGSYNPYQ